MYFCCSCNRGRMIWSLQRGRSLLRVVVNRSFTVNILHSKLQQSYYIKCQWCEAVLVFIIINIIIIIIYYYALPCSTLFLALNIYIIVIVVIVVGIFIAGFQIQRGRCTNKLI